MIYFKQDLQEIKSILHESLTQDKANRLGLVMYEWHFAAKTINAIDEGPLRDQWFNLVQSKGFKLKEEHKIPFEGFCLSMKVYATPGSNRLPGLDPLAVAVAGYMKAQNEWVVFEIDHSKNS